MQYIQASWINVNTGSHNAIIPTKETLDTIVAELKQPMTGATTSAAGTSGMVPVPSAGASDRFLCSDSTWKIPYILPAATSTTLGGVIVGNNITNTSGTISLTAQNIINALGYTPSNSGDVNSDSKVRQNAAITTNGNYPIILGFNTATTEIIDSVNKASTLTFNPNSNTLFTPNLTINENLLPDTNLGSTIGSTALRFNAYLGTANINTLQVGGTTTTENLTINNQAVPDANNGANIGTSSLRFNNGYFSTVNTATGIIPDAAGGAYLGTSSNYFSSVYATNLYNRSGTTNYRVPVVFSGTSVPSSSLGSNGDIYIQYVN